MPNTSIIFRLKAENALEQMRLECLQLLGAGANRQTPKIIEETFALCNTPPQNGYVRIVATPEFAQMLQTVKDQGYESPFAELVLIEWDGQTEFVTAEHDDPEFGHTRELLGYMAELPIKG